ncbi:DUF981 domain-containing protein [Thermus islandicus]|uniref:DUF981 domain-containing protein n=1 Tax=Thermus islandicus TaxID=540988 RepID=UPI0003B3D570|nr:DUF981 domain-containing protein [Thermus islandicus]
MGSYNPLVFVLGLVTAAGVSGVAYLLALARGAEERALGQRYGPLFFALGVFALGGVAQLYWTQWAGRPMPQYTELFGVATGLFAFMMVMAGFYLYRGLGLEALAWPAAFLGLFLLQGARAAWDFGLTRNPALTALMWATAGLASLGILPFAFSRPEGRRVWAYLGALVLALMALAAFLTGFLAYYGHIAEAVRR